MKVNTLNHLNAEFKKRLHNCNVSSDIWYAGQLPSAEYKTVGIVGTRRPTPYGIQVLKLLTEGLRGYKINVISGLAIGIDSLAHRQAMLCKLPTTAVIPADLQHIYPPSHRGLANLILKNGGGLVSPYKQLTRPYSSNFYERNRLLAAMCDAIVVIEAAKRSGTMITVGYGLEFGKPILAVPGRVGDSMSFGTNQLIAQGATPLLASIDIIEAVGLNPVQQSLFFTEEQQTIGKLLDGGLNEINAVQQQSQLGAQQFNSLLTSMELDGLIRIEAGHIYKRGVA